MKHFTWPPADPRWEELLSLFAADLHERHPEMEIMVWLTQTHLRAKLKKGTRKTDPDWVELDMRTPLKHLVEDGDTPLKIASSLAALTGRSQSAPSVQPPLLRVVS